MLEIFTSAGSKQDAIAIIKNDHEKVKALFEQFEATDDLREKKKIAAEAIMELKIHAEIEEKIFYPTVREDVEDDIMYEADEEHHVAKLLIAELDQMDGSEDNWEAKFIVLAENIRHHIKEEEGEMLPQARKAEVDFAALGEKLLMMKQELKKNGVPMSDEEKLMSGTRAKYNSPARAAKAKPAAKARTRKSVSSASARAGAKKPTKRGATARAGARKTSRSTTSSSRKPKQTAQRTKASAAKRRKG